MIHKSGSIYFDFNRCFKAYKLSFETMVTNKTNYHYLVDLKFLSGLGPELPPVSVFRFFWFGSWLRDLNMCWLTLDCGLESMMIISSIFNNAFKSIGIDQ